MQTFGLNDEELETHIKACIDILHDKRQTRYLELWSSLYGLASKYQNNTKFTSNEKYHYIHITEC